MSHPAVRARCSLWATDTARHPVTPANPTVTSIATHTVPATRSGGDRPVNATQATWTRDGEHHCHPPLGGRTWAPRGREQDPSPLTQPGEAEIPRGLITRGSPGPPRVEMFSTPAPQALPDHHKVTSSPCSRLLTVVIPSHGCRGGRWRSRGRCCWCSRRGRLR